MTPQPQGSGPGPDDDPVSACLAACLAAYQASRTPPRETEGQAVRELLGLLVERVPGHSVEVRVPPYAAVQVVGGPRHRRGTPPAGVECDARTWIELATGKLTWQQAVSQGRLTASGANSDLSPFLPLTPAPAPAPGPAPDREP